MRRFVQVNADGNVTGWLESPHPPGSDPTVVAEGHVEVTDIERADVEWFNFRWTGSEFVEREDQPEPSAATAGIEERLSNIEAMLEQLTNGS
tara:strand:- start:498 stop:773 length:276 start_codon:yes stop_codon:yes gene_type:complete